MKKLLTIVILCLFNCNVVFAEIGLNCFITSVGKKEINSNRVELPVNVTEFDKLDNISFNANLFKDVLVANKECGNARLRVSKDGLAHIKFQVDKYVSEYFLVASANKR